jgi:membrane-associated protease RseP (regulator of RpoE activity)
MAVLFGPVTDLGSLIAVWRGSMRVGSGSDQSEDSLRSPFREYALPALLLAAAVVTTTANGARLMEDFVEGRPAAVGDGDLWPWAWLASDPHRFRGGFAFSVSLLAIILIHEFGHWWACRAHRIRATLPWVLPAPTLGGTAGALIRIRSAIPNRNALVDLGIYGPLAGFLASVAALATGFVLSRPAHSSTPNSLVRFGTAPPALSLLHLVLAHWNPAIPSFSSASPHPVLIAGWIGLLLTSLNLIPAGQLDGGHLLYALSPRLHRIATHLLPVVLILCGLWCWAGWILWGLILMIPALGHPPIRSASGLSRGRIVLAALGALIFLLAFTPTPFSDGSVVGLLHRGP